MASFALDGIDHVALNVRDLQRSIDWYREVLGLEPRFEEWAPVPTMLCAGETCVALFPAEQPSDEPGSPQKRQGMRHLAFRLDRAGFQAAQQELSDRSIEFRFSDHGSAHSIYFDDPDGHKIELTTYEV